jgi:hypothetical protein
MKPRPTHGDVTRFPLPTLSSERNLYTKKRKNRLPLCLSPEAMSVGGRINKPEDRQLNDLFLVCRYAAPAAWNSAWKRLIDVTRRWFRSIGELLNGASNYGPKCQRSGPAVSIRWTLSVFRPRWIGVTSFLGSKRTLEWTANRPWLSCSRLSTCRVMQIASTNPRRLLEKGAGLSRRSRFHFRKRCSFRG